MLDQRRKVMLAAAGSFGLHVLVLLLWAVWSTFAPHSAKKEPRPETPLRLTFAEDKPELTPLPEPTPAATPPPVAPFADTTGMAEAATPPPDAKLVSARNTVDASEVPANGKAPGPAQTGEQNSTFAVQTQAYVAGDEPAPAAGTPPPVAEMAPPLPQPVAQPTTRPVPPAPTPVPGVDGYALATPASLPTEPEAEANPFDPSFRPPNTLTEPPLPTPVRRSGYQPQALKTARSGSIGNVEATGSVASRSTPTGRYQATIIAAIRKRWLLYVDQRLDLLQLGTVTVRFLVGMDGKARGIQVVSNTSNEALASITLRAIMEAEIPPMPPDAIPTTDGGQLSMSLPFELLTTQQP